MDALKPGRATASLAIIICIGIALRLHGAGTLPIWMDEAYSYWSASQSWSMLWLEVPRYETHPPAFYSLVKLWLVFGDSELVLRLLPSLLGILAIPLAYISGRAIGGTPCGLLAAMLMACAPWQIIQAQNLRPYTLVTLATALVLAGALTIVNNPARAAIALWRPAKGGGRMFAAYGALATGNALLLWSHNLNILLCACLGLFLLLWWWREGRDRTVFLNLLFSLLCAMLLYLPNIAFILAQFSVVSSGWWLSAPSVPSLLFQTLELFGFPLYGSRPSVNLLINAVLLLPYVAGALAAVRVGRSPTLRHSAALLVACAFGPWLVALLITFLLVPVFLDRTLTMVQLPACLLLAMATIAVDRLTPIARRLGYVLLFSVPLVVAVGFHLRDQRALDVDRGWKQIVAVIAAQADGTPPVFAIPNAAAIPLDYYARRLESPIAIVPLPAPYPAPGHAEYPSGNRAEPAIEASSLDPLRRRLAGQEEAWLVARAASLFDPAQRVEKALAAHFPCRTYYFGSVEKPWMVAIRYSSASSGRCAAPSASGQP